MRYPNGQGKSSFGAKAKKKTNKVFSNRGMTLEEDINTTNKYYLRENKAVIHKKPTPVQIVNVNYPRRSAAVITEAYFKQASTTDYNGIYRGKYIDFEAKETNNKTRFPLANIHDHQIRHMQSIVDHGGICFVIIRFSTFDETYLMTAEKLFSYWYNKWDSGKKSITYEEICNHSYFIPFHYQARVNYLSIVDKLYF